MAKLRKTLGSPTEPAVVALMEGMEGKSKETLTTWAMAYVTEKYLPLVAEVPLFSELLEKTTDCMACLLYTSPSPRDRTRSRMPSSA